MNVFLLHEILSERYNSHYTELRNKLINLSTKGPLCINCNPHSSRAVGHSMQKSLKLKFQNAVNQIAFADGDTPALFVGGRRRNRKKRKNKNGQNKKKSKKETEQEAPILLTSITPDFEYYQDIKPRRSTVSCLDIEEPVFIYEPVGNKQTLITAQTGYDSIYNSNESLDSNKTRRDSGCEDEKLTDDDEDDNNSNDHIETNNTIKDEIDETVKFPRLHSRDSGVYDDVEDDVTSVDDAGFYDESIDDSLVSTSDDGEMISSIKDELAQAESELELSTEVTGDSEVFEDIDLTNNDEDESEQEVINSTVESSVVQNEIKIITEIDHISNREHFLNLVDDDDDIIFDISQLELNTTQDDISNIGKDNFQLNHDKGSIFYPTELEEGPLEKLPMDLLIEDDKDDEVLFEAASRRELSITCNPLYEQTIKDEEEKLSIKSYQSGFKTNFDSVEYIRMPGSGSNKTKKESSPLLKCQDKEDELACCIIL